MPGNRITASSGGTVTVKIKPIRAACPENQAALDRLQERLIKEQQSNPGSNFVYTVRKALNSLKDCDHPIVTRKGACELKHIGPALSKIIVPSNNINTATSATTSPGGSKIKTKKSTSKNIVAPAVRPSSLLQSQSANRGESETKPAPSTSDQSKKEKAYHKAKHEAENLKIPPKGPWKVILVIDAREKKSQQVVSQCKQSGIPCEERTLPIGDMAWIAQCVEPKTHGMSSQSKPIELMVGTIIERKHVSDLASSLYGTRYSEQRLRLSQCGLPQVLFLVEGDITQVQTCPAETMLMAMMETRIQLGFQVIQTKHLSETVRVMKGLHRRIVQRTFPEAFDKYEGIAVPTFVADPHETAPCDGRVNTNGRRRNRRPSSLLEMCFDTEPVPPFGTSRFISYEELKTKVEMDRERGTRSVQAITMAMLKQIPTLSLKKCTAIAQQYPTMNRLVKALCYHRGDPEVMISNIPMSRKTIGPKSASEVVAACCTLGDGSVVASHAPTKVATTVMAKPGKSWTDASTLYTAHGNAANIAKDCEARAQNAEVYQSDAFNQRNVQDDNAASEESFSVAPVGSFASKKRPPSVATIDVAKTPVNSKRKIDKQNKMWDMSRMSPSTVSLPATFFRPAESTDRRQTPMAYNRTDISLFSSPDDSVLESSLPSTKLHAVVPQKRKASSETNVKIATNPLVIDVLDSDSDYSPDNKKLKNGRQMTCFERDIQLAIRNSFLETPSTSSTFSTPSISSSMDRVARKVSNDSSSDGNEAYDTEPSTLRDRLARRLDKTVIEILD